MQEGCNTSIAQEMKLIPVDTGYGGGCTTADRLEELMQSLAVTKEEHADQISICSLDWASNGTPWEL